MARLGTEPLRKDKLPALHGKGKRVLCGGDGIKTFAFIESKRTPGTWDLGIDYEKVKAEFERILRVETNPIHYSNFATLLIQLVNAARISEAVDAWNEFLNTGGRDLQVRLRKRWKKDKVTKEKKQIIEYRRMLVPAMVEQRGTLRTVGAVKTFANRQGGNTHSMRYSLIGYLSAKLKEPPQVIAKITKHKKLDQLIRYSQQHLADELLERVAK